MTQEERNEVLHHIGVEKAYLEGKEIEYRKIDIWQPCPRPVWNWAECDYRVKPEHPKLEYRPFESAEEVMEAIKEHGSWLRSIEEGYGVYNQIYSVDNRGIVTYACDASYEWALKIFVWADGTPFGKLIEEK